MSTWIEASLQDAVAALLRSGEREIAAALGRLLGEPELRQLQLFRAPEAEAIADEIIECDTLEALHELLPAVAAVLGVRHCTVHCVRDSAASAYATRVLTTYPEAWVAEYVGKRYLTVDPVMARCSGAPGMFFWDELPADSPITRRFLASATEHGVGPSGVTLLGADEDGNPVAVSLACGDDPAQFRQAFGLRTSDFADLGALLIDVFSELARPRARPKIRASEDQLKVLRALISGKSLDEIAGWRFAYGSFATVQKSILQTFGATTLYQAAGIAARTGLLEGLPYFEEEIVPGRGSAHAGSPEDEVHGRMLVGYGTSTIRAALYRDTKEPQPAMSIQVGA
jgi:hypothetical protein